MTYIADVYLATDRLWANIVLSVFMNHTRDELSPVSDFDKCETLVIK